jgi:WD40 repeat protein
LITCAKDKKIKVWDWMNKSLIATLAQHTDEVTSIVLTSDTNKSILFSASLDMKIIAWHTKLYDALFEITLEHPVSTLRLT